MPPGADTGTAEEEDSDDDLEVKLDMPAEEVRLSDDRPCTRVKYILVAPSLFTSSNFFSGLGLEFPAQFLPSGVCIAVLVAGLC